MQASAASGPRALVVDHEDRKPQSGPARRVLRTLAGDEHASAPAASPHARIGAFDGDDEEIPSPSEIAWLAGACSNSLSSDHPCTSPFRASAPSAAGTSTIDSGRRLEAPVSTPIGCRPSQLEERRDSYALPVVPPLTTATLSAAIASSSGISRRAATSSAFPSSEPEHGASSA